jgi:hypothetical protein
MRKITSGADLAHRIVLQWRQGTSIRALVRQYDISRNTP